MGITCLSPTKRLCVQTLLLVATLKVSGHGQIKGFNSAVYAIKCQEVVIELWSGSYRTVFG